MASSRWGFFAKRHRRPTGQVALSLSNERVALAVLPEAGAAAVSERPTGGDEAGTLAALVREAGAAGMACRWILDPSLYTLLQVDRPAVPEAEWIRALRWKVRDLISFPIEEAVMDAFEVPGLESRGRAPTLYVAVARKEDLRPRIAAIEASGLQMAGIGISDLAFAEVTRRLSKTDDSLATLVLDARGGSMLAMRDDALFVVRRFEFDADERRALGDPAASTAGRLQERVALELQRTLDYFDRTHQRPPPRRLLLVDGTDGADGLPEALRNLLGIEVQRADPATIWPALSGERAPAKARLSALVAAVGAA